MKRVVALVVVVVAVVIIIILTTSAADSGAQVINVNAPLLYLEEDGSVHAFASGDYPVLFGIYLTASGGDPLWEREQMVEVGGDGRFEVTLGPIEGSVFERDEGNSEDTGVRYLEYSHRDAIAMGRTVIVASEYGTTATSSSLEKAAADPRPVPWHGEDTTGDTLYYKSADWYTQSQVRELTDAINAMKAKMDSLEQEIDDMSP